MREHQNLQMESTWSLLLALFAGFTCLLLLLARVSQVVRYYTKFISYIVTSLFASTIPIPLMLFRPRSSKNALIPAWCLRVVSRLLGMDWTVRGIENIVKDSGCIVVINHQSALDLTVLAVLWPLMDRCTQIAKKSLFYLWPFGLACWLWGTVFIDRVNAMQAQQIINSTEKVIKKKKSRVLMFPEGTRGSGKELLPFKKGAFHLAITAQCPIQPVVVSRYHFLISDKKYFGAGKTIITILPPIPTLDMTKDDISELVERTRNQMVDCFNETSSEVGDIDFNRNNNMNIKRDKF